MNSFFQTFDKKVRLFILLQILFDCVLMIETLFINTFLLKSYGSFSSEVLLYNAAMALAQPPAMLLALFISKKKSAQLTQKFSFLFYTLALLFLCIFGEKISFLYLLFAVLNSFGAGFYYTTYSTQMLSYTTDQNRDQIAGLVGLLGAILSISLPLLSGFLISMFDSFLGYRIVFGISALMSAAALITASRLRPVDALQKTFPLSEVAHTLLHSAKGLLSLIASGFESCINFTIPIFVTLLFYNLLPSEWLISINSVVGNVAGLLSAALYCSKVRSYNRSKYSLLAAVFILLPCIVMFFKLNIAVIFVFQAVYSLFSRFLTTPVLHIYFKTLEELELHQGSGAEAHLLRELFVSAGRLLGLLLLFVTPQTNGSASLVLGIMMLLAIVNVAILKKIERPLNSL